MLMKKLGLVFFTFFLLLYSCKKEEAKRIDAVLSLAGLNRIELEAVLNHYKYEPQKLKAAKFLISNMRYHHSFYSVRNDDQHPLLDSLTMTADSILYSIVVSTDSLYSRSTMKELANRRSEFKKQHGIRVTEQPANIHWKEDYDFHWLTSEQLIKHIDLMFELKKQLISLQQLPIEDFYEYVLPYRAIPDCSLVDFSDTYYRFMNKYMENIDRDSIRDVIRQYNYVIGQLRNFFPSYPYQEEIGYQELFFHGFHDCIPIANYGASILRACGMPVAIEFNSCYKQFQGRHFHAAVLNDKNKWLTFNPESSLPTFDNRAYDTANVLNIYRFMFSEQKDSPFFLKRAGEYVPDMFDIPFLKDVTSHLLKTVSLVLPYQKEGDNVLAYLAAFNSTDGVVPVTWGKVDRKSKSVKFSSVIPDRYYFPIYYSSFGKSYSFAEPFYLNKGGKIEAMRSVVNRTRTVTVSRKFPQKKGLISKSRQLIGTVILAANEPEFRKCDTVGVISTLLPPYFQDISLNMNKGPYQYYRIKTTNQSPHAYISELEFITDVKYGYENVTSATPLPIFSQADTLQEEKTEIRLMDEPLERIKWKAEYDGNPQTAPGAYPTINFTLKRPQFVTKVRLMPLNADNGIVPNNQYELLYWKNGEWKKISEQLAKFNYLVFDVPQGALLWLRNLTKGKEELPFYLDDEGKQVFIYS